MGKKFLGKVVAGAALGGAALLVGAPAAAFADGHSSDDNEKGQCLIFAYPETGTSPKMVKIGLVCSKEQMDPEVKLYNPGPISIKVKKVKSDNQSDGKELQDCKDDKDGRPEPAADLAPPQGTGGGVLQDGHDQDKKDEDCKKDDQMNSSDGMSSDGKEKFVYEIDYPTTGLKPGVKYYLTGNEGSKGWLQMDPEGSVDGGNGGSMVNKGLASGGAGVLAAAAIGGVAVLRRRRADGSIA